MLFAKEQKLSFVIPVWQRIRWLHILLNSILLQTDSRWEIVLVYDGDDKNDRDIRLADKAIHPYLAMFPNKIKYFKMPPQGKWGHPARNFGLKHTTGQFVVMSGHDNYYCPIFVEEFHAITIKDNADLIYCDMLHNCYKYQQKETKLELYKIDCGAVAVRRELLLELGGFNPEVAAIADWDFIDRLIKTKNPNIEKIEKTLFIHN